MKTIRRFNEFAIGIPVFFGLLGFVWNDAWGIALLSTMLTGLLQLVAALLYWNENPESTLIKVYFAGVAVFFIIWILLRDIDIIILIFPPALCLLLCWIIYRHNFFGHEKN